MVVVVVVLVVVVVVEVVVDVVVLVVVVVEVVVDVVVLVVVVVEVVVDVVVVDVVVLVVVVVEVVVVSSTTIILPSTSFTIEVMSLPYSSEMNALDHSTGYSPALQSLGTVYVSLRTTEPSVAAVPLPSTLANANSFVESLATRVSP